MELDLLPTINSTCVCVWGGGDGWFTIKEVEQYVPRRNFVLHAHIFIPDPTDSMYGHGLACGLGPETRIASRAPCKYKPAPLFVGGTGLQD